jgi:hypothetical protein
MIAKAIEDISSRLGLRKVQDKYAQDGVSYQGVMATGCFPIHDYGQGLVFLKVRNPIKWDSHNVVVSVQTIDDGLWQGLASEPVDVEKLVEAINKQYPKRLPSLALWCELMEEYGVYGVW